MNSKFCNYNVEKVEKLGENYVPLIFWLKIDDIVEYKKCLMTLQKCFLIVKFPVESDSAVIGVEKLLLNIPKCKFPNIPYL